MTTRSECTQIDVSSNWTLITSDEGTGCLRSVGGSGVEGHGDQVIPYQPRVPAATLGTLLHPPAERVSIKMSGNKRNGRGSHTFRGRGVKKGERLKRNSETQERREGEGG